MAIIMPPGHHTITSSFIVDGVAKVIDFMVAAFDATVVDRYDGPEGVVFHAEVQIGDSILMMGDGQPGFEPMPAMLGIYVEDCDATFARALAAGATEIEAPKDMFYGYRTARVKDVGGNKWAIQQVKELLSKEEIEKRMASEH